jgi:4-diphosphocytidyl-2-C-methyl-D-erythritol kinase
MTVRRALARAKINLALHVLGRRDDGYHEIDSIVAFADFGDELSVSQAAQSGLTVTGPFAGDVPQGADNIVLKSLGLAADFGFLAPTVAIQLDKQLPVASGMGGGSSDAAAVLQLLFPQVPTDVLRKSALRLGADLPVCIHNRLCRMRGVGETISDLGNLGPFHALLVNPRVPVATADVFRALGLKSGKSHRSGIADEANPLHWRNDLTEAAIAVTPEIAGVLAAIGKMPRIKFARMSGSGATCFGIFGTREDAQSAAELLASRHPDWWMRATTLS